MAEDTFIDRAQRSAEMRDIIVLLTPAYNPGVPASGEMDLRMPAFTTKIAAANTANQDVANAAAAYNYKAGLRETKLTEVLKAGTSVLSYLRSKKKTMEALLKSAERIVAKMRGPKKKAETPPPAPGDPPPAKERNRGARSYMEQAGHLKTLYTLLTGKPGYTPDPANPASVAFLTGLYGELDGLNTELCTLNANLIHAESLREVAYRCLCGR